MCGLAAVLAGDPAKRQAIVTSLLGTIEHRGRPGTLHEVGDAGDGCTMGANRLPIVAPAANRQPGSSPSGQFRIVMNGEIFNYRELVGLTRVNPRSSPAGDTAVLAAAIENWGVARTLASISWEGAFICADTIKGTVVAVRDHLGIKPLYYTVGPDQTVFASEIKSLVALGGDQVIQPVPPGSTVTIHPEHPADVQTRTWWSVDEASAAVSPGDSVADATHELIREAVRLRVPGGKYAVALSGGLDSSLVLRLAVAVSDRMTAYVLHRDKSPDLMSARRLCAELGVPLVEVRAPEPAVLRAELADTVRTVETWEWQVVNHAAPMGALFAAIRSDGHNVVLTGEGADELFHGYTNPDDGVDAAALHAERLVRVASLHRTNCRRLDRMGMRYSLECRVPFLDRALTTYALSLSADVTVGHGANKRPVRDVAARVLPAWLAQRRKLSFARGVGYEYSTGEVASVFGPTCLLGEPGPLPDRWERLARYPIERVFLSSFLTHGYDRAAYLCSRSS